MSSLHVLVIMTDKILFEMVAHHLHCVKRDYHDPLRITQIYPFICYKAHSYYLVCLSLSQLNDNSSDVIVDTGGLCMHTLAGHVRKMIILSLTKETSMLSL